MHLLRHNYTLKLTNDTVESKTLANNPNETDSSSGSGSAFGGNPNIIRITHPGHGMTDSKPSKVTISGLGSTTDYNGIAGSVINGTHDIGNVTEDTYTITLSGDPATSTGSVGGTAVVATQDRAFEVYKSQIMYWIFLILHLFILLKQLQHNLYIIVKLPFNNNIIYKYCA